MKITRRQLKRIIREELSRSLSENEVKKDDAWKRSEKELTKDDFKLFEPMKKWLKEKLVSLGTDEKVAKQASAKFRQEWQNTHEDESLKRVKAMLEEKITDGNWGIIASYPNADAIAKRLQRAVPYHPARGTTSDEEYLKHFPGGTRVGSSGTPDWQKS